MSTRAKSPANPSRDGSPAFPKPLKRDRPNEERKREIRRKDRELARSTETLVCARCGRTGKTEPHHKIRRRHMAHRFDPANIERVCMPCHEIAQKERAPDLQI